MNFEWLDRVAESAKFERLNYLDGWRGIAILLVLIGHFFSDAIIPGFSVLGVDLFFVLSGRLMAEILFVRQLPVKTFFVRRFSRVYPALFVYVITIYILSLGTPYGNGPVAVISALTFTVNYAMVYGHQIAFLDHLWSLCVEEHAYLLLAFIAAAVVRKPHSAAIVLLAIGSAAMMNGIVRSLMQETWFPKIAWRTDVQIAPLFIAGGIYLIARKSSFFHQGWISPTCMILGFIVKIHSEQIPIQFGLGTLLLALAVATIDYAYDSFKTLLGLEPLCRIGLWSFSLYLWQQPFYKLAHMHVESSTMSVMAALCIGTASFYVVEVPLRNAINERWRQRMAIN